MKLTDRKAFGRTGLHVPRVVYGTSYLGNLYRELPYPEKLELIRQWFQCTEKPVVIDTAGKYGAGLALEVIGRGLSELGIDPGGLYGQWIDVAGNHLPSASQCSCHCYNP